MAWKFTDATEETDGNNILDAHKVLGHVGTAANDERRWSFGTLWSWIILKITANKSDINDILGTSRVIEFVEIDHASSGLLNIDCNIERYIVTASANITGFTITNRPTNQGEIEVLIRAVNWGAYSYTFSTGGVAFNWSGFVLPNMTPSGTDEILLTIGSNFVNANLVERDIRNA